MAHAHRRAPGRRSWSALVLTGAVAVLATGCVWGPRSRPVREGERLQLPAAVAVAPAGAGWSVYRELDDPERRLLVFQGPDPDHATRWLGVVETRGLGSPEEVAGELRRLALDEAQQDLRAPSGPAETSRVEVPPRFGPAAVATAGRLEQSEASAGLLRRKAVCFGALVAAPPGAPDHLVFARHVELGWADELSPEACARGWAGALEAVVLRPPDRENTRTAARAGDFPKNMQQRLARRSLTLPRGGFQVGWERSRWIAPGGFSGALSLAIGLTDRLEVSAPGYLRFAFGEAEALTRPELAIGLGLNGYERDATRGNAWTLGADAAVRRRVARDVTLRGGLLAEATHESRTGRTHPAVQGSAGVVWDTSRYASLGLEAGACSSRFDGRDRGLVWVGGYSTPVVTVLLPLLDVGLTAAAAWDGERVGARVGLRLLLTL